MDFAPVLSCQLVCLRLAAFLECFSTRKAKRDTNIPILPVSIRMCRRLPHGISEALNSVVRPKLHVGSTSKCVPCRAYHLP